MSVEEKFIRSLHAHRHEHNKLHAEPGRAHAIYQSSLLNSLLKGIYDGELSFKDLAAHGDFGLGTFNALDGEMIAFDGRFYQIHCTGVANAVKPSQKTPFALVTFFKPEVSFSVKEPMDYEAFGRYLDKAVPSTNLFYSVKVTGFFDLIKARSVPRQKKPYRPLLEVVGEQAVFEFQRIKGTLAGFRFPDYTEGINVPGYHLHFLSEDGTKGGHVMECHMRGVKIEIDHTANLHLEMPQQGDFLKGEFAKSDGNSIRKIER